MRKSFVLLAVGLALAGEAFARLDAGVEKQISASIVKVRVVNESRRVATGSAVSVGGGVLVTSCHGLRHARAIQILGPGLAPTVTSLVKDIEHDLCLLGTSEAIPPLAVAQDDEGLKVGDFVAAFGFAGPEVHLTRGTVKALHPYQGGKVIQTDAVFASGESGGALVDREGRLVGILTFFAPGRGDSYFAVPVSWLRDLIARVQIQAPAGRQPDLSFWERTDRDRPTFLEAAAHEYAQDWSGLTDVASDWVKQEPWNPQAWIALGKAHYHGGRDRAAIDALQEAVRIDPQQPVGWYYLGASYREIDEPQGVQDALERLDLLSPTVAKALRDGTPME